MKNIDYKAAFWLLVGTCILCPIICVFISKFVDCTCNWFEELGKAFACSVGFMMFLLICGYIGNNFENKK